LDFFGMASSLKRTVKSGAAQHNHLRCLCATT
jgi:hypothetical protein